MNQQPQSPELSAEIDPSIIVGDINFITEAISKLREEALAIEG